MLAIARSQGRACHALTVDYGQRHRAELDASRRVAKALGAVEHRLIKIDLRAIGGSALTDDIEVPVEGLRAGIPVTYVPARNTVFLSLALGYAEVAGSDEIWIGVNAVDYSGYPDCRPEFIRAFEALANLATKAGVEGTRFRIMSPLVDLSKADIVRRAVALGVPLGETVSCYQAGPGGEACGACDSCRIRAAAFAEAGLADPAL